jgi:hypothetical protein
MLDEPLDNPKAKRLISTILATGVVTFRSEEELVVVTAWRAK